MGTFSTVLAVREFRSIWLAEAASIAGDQLARVALSLLVYQRTASTGLTALTYALTFLPSMVGGVLLSRLADRYPRRSVMVVTDLARAILVIPMALPGVPLALLCVLLTVVVTLHGPFKAAQLALLADILTGDRYATGLAIRHITIQTAQLAGFAGGGVLVALIGPQLALGLDATTFLVSAALVGVGVRQRPAAAPDLDGADQSLRARMRAAASGGIHVIWRDRGLRTLFLLSLLPGFHIVPEALAAPYADRLHGQAVAVGLLMASDPAGSVIGAFVFTRWFSEAKRVRLIGPLAVAAAVPMLLGMVYPSLALSMLLFAMSGVCAMAYHVQLGATFAQRLPNARRAQGLGVMSTGLVTAQGLGGFAAGVAAEFTGPGLAITLAGAVGVLIAVPLAVGWNRSDAVRTGVI
ncbi:MFS transporter [Flindersiella endophytica]